jgi:hypothetical protein
LTDESAIKLMSFEPRVPLIEPAVRELSEDGELAELDDPAELEDELLLSPIFAFFSTKPPPAADVLLLLLDDAVLSRCRQPVAVIWPAMSLDERPAGWLLCGVDPVVGWLLGGVVGWLLCGVCAVRVPHSATPLQSVTAHRQ